MQGGVVAESISLGLLLEIKNRGMEQANAVLEKLEAAEKKAAASAKAMAAQVDAATAQVDTAAGEAAGAVDKLNATAAKASASAAEVDTAAVAAGAAGEAAMAAEGAAAGGAADDVESGTGRQISSFGKFGLAAGAAAVVFAGVAVKMGIEWQDTMDTLANSARIPEDAANKIGDALTGISNQTVFSATQLADGVSSIAGSWEQYTGHALTASDATTLASAAAKEAQVTHGQFGTVIGALTSTMEQFHEPASAVNSVMDDLYNTSRATGIPLDTLTASFGKMQKGLGNVAPSLSDISAITDELAVKMPNLGSRGISVVSTGFQTLLGGSKNVTAELAKLGVNLFDSSGKIVGMQSAIKQLGPALAGMTEQQRLAAEKILFTSGASSVMDTIFNGGVDTFNRYSAAVSKTGTVQDAYNETQKTLGVQMKELQNQASNLTREFGTFLVGAIMKVEQVAGPAFEKFRDVAGAALDVIEQHKGQILAALAGIGAAILIEVVPPMYAWATAAVATAAGMVVAAAPFVAMAAAIALLSVGIYELVTHFHDIVAAAEQAWGAVRNFIQTAVNDVLSFLQAHWQLIVGILTGPIGAAVLLIVDNWGKIKAATEAAWNAVTGLITGALAAMIAALGDAWSAILDAATTVWDAVRTLFATTWDGIRTTVTTVTAAISTTITTVLTAIETAFITTWGAIRVTVSTVIGAIRDAISSTLGTIEGALSGAWSTILSAATGGFDTVRTTVSGILTSLYSDVTRIGGDIVNYFADLPGEILSAVGDLGSLLYHAGASLIQGLIDGVNSMIDKIPGGSMVTSALGKIGGFFASGGAVGADIPIVVGERGPELFVPNVPGMVVPNHVLSMIAAPPIPAVPSVPAYSSPATAGRTVTVVNNFGPITATDPRDFVDQVSQLMKQNIFTGIRIP